MAVLSILNPKGGSGKTTLSINLARSLHEAGQRVLLVDSDPQGSARDWHAADEDNPLPLIALDRPSNVKTLASMAASYDWVIIDGAAKLADMMTAAIKISDLVLIPVQPSPYDIWAASDLVDFTKARQDITDGTPSAAFVITRMIEGTKLGQEVNAALSEYGLPIMETRITQRQIYPQTAAEGLTVFDAANEKALREMKALTAEILAWAAAHSQEVVTHGA
ncbi:MAG: AAA family ATPase [Rhodobiaceae bacterium]|jgi:chromosome partitioning protein|nr:AAA family ATPase [Rhodobiaceae bacterium]